MKRSLTLRVLPYAAVAVASVALTSTVLSDGAEHMDETMAAWMELAAVGPQHEKLAELEGTWDMKSSMWMYPGADPEHSVSTCTMTPVLGGRFVREEVKGEMRFAGESYPFEGLSYLGFDNQSQKYTYVWMDSMGTMMMFAEGDEDADGNIVYMSTITDPMTNQPKRYKSIHRDAGDDKFIFEMHEELPGGGWHKHFELVATRV